MWDREWFIKRKEIINKSRRMQQMDTKFTLIWIYKEKGDDGLNEMSHKQTP